MLFFASILKLSFVFMAGKTAVGNIIFVGVANIDDNCVHDTDDGVVIDECIKDGVSINWVVVIATDEGFCATSFPTNAFVAIALAEDTFFIQLTLFCL
jgi:hypothetical protein